MLGGDEKDIQFNCSINYAEIIDTATNWLRENPGSSFHLTRNNVSNYPRDYEIEGEYNLVIKNVTIHDAIYYECRNSLQGDKNVIAIAYLMVFGNNY